jgi:hypothetical protein
MKRKLQFALDDGGFNEVIIHSFSSCKMPIRYGYIILIILAATYAFLLLVVVVVVAIEKKALSDATV